MPVMRRRKHLFAALVLQAGATAPSISLGDSHPDYFLHGRYTPTSGQVGQPFYADATFEVDDMPGNCVAEWKDIVISGVLPPGLDVASSNSSAIAGTPTIAGDWPVIINFHALGCTYNTKDGVDRAIKAVFHIAK